MTHTLMSILEVTEVKGKGKPTLFQRETNIEEP
jgi:hypothetical protein